LVFLLLLIYDYPFLGPGAISSEPMRLLPAQYWVMEAPGDKPLVQAQVGAEPKVQTPHPS
jgi:hypothetical protein